MKIIKLFRPKPVAAIGSGSRRGVYRSAFCSILAAGVLSACGGGIGELIAIAIVTPLGGVWSASDGDGQIVFIPQDEVFASKYDLRATATTTTVVSACGGSNAPVDLEGTLDNGSLVLHPVGVTTNCLEGRFTDLVTLELMAGPTKLVYLNDRVDVRMDLGLWVSDGDGQLKLKFERPDRVDNGAIIGIEGCDVSTATFVNFIGDMNGFDTGTKAKPFILELTRDPPSGAPLFTQVVFVDGATLTLVLPGGQPLTLHRKPDTTTTCP